MGLWRTIHASDLPMSVPAAEPVPAVMLLRFAYRALRVSASTVAVVALLRQQWLGGAAFSLAWLLILGAPRFIPQLQSHQPPDGDGAPPPR